METAAVAHNYTQSLSKYLIAYHSVCDYVIFYIL